MFRKLIQRNFRNQELSYQIDKLVDTPKTDIKEMNTTSGKFVQVKIGLRNLFCAHDPYSTKNMSCTQEIS